LSPFLLLIDLRPQRIESHSLKTPLSRATDSNRTAKTHTESVLKNTSKEGNSSATETENHSNNSTKRKKLTHTSERETEKAERRRRRGER
jgi:hypothetical protein